MEVDHSVECCGFGGTFSVKQPEISAAMAKDKTQAIWASGADTLVSQDCGCLMHLGGTFARQGQGPEAAEARAALAGLQGDGDHRVAAAALDGLQA